MTRFAWRLVDLEDRVQARVLRAYGQECVEHLLLPVEECCVETPRIASELHVARERDSDQARQTVELGADLVVDVSHPVHVSRFEDLEKVVDAAYAALQLLTALQESPGAAPRCCDLIGGDCDASPRLDSHHESHMSAVTNVRHQHPSDRCLRA